MAARGRYTLVRKIADGGTAEVFLANMEGSAGFKRLVVLKRVLPSLWADENFRKGLIDEAHIAMGLHHNNIVQVLDLGGADGRYFLVFELVNGWTLAQVLKRMQATNLTMPLNLALHIMAEVCRALAYAHSRTENGVPLAIVHRDVTPQNVLLSEQGEVKLTDFGIARARTRATTSQVGTVKGKPAFMSPEQAQGKPLDARSDLFPIGTMLYQLAVGELPFGASAGHETMLRIISGKYVSPATRRPDLPKEFVRIINTALKRKVEERYQSADEMLRAIEKVQRTVLEPAGATELKAWLAELAAKDGAVPLSAAGAPMPPPLPEDSSSAIELKDEDIVFTEEPAKPRRSRWPLALAVVAVLAALGGWYSTQPTPTLVALADALDAGPVAEVLPPEPIPTATAEVDAGEVLVELDAGEADADAGVAEVDAGPALATAEVDAGLPDAAVEVEVAAVDAAAPDAAVELADAGLFDASVTAPARATPPTPPRPPPPVERTPPAAAPADQMISVLVETDPPGANLRIDRRLFGKTPIPIRLKVGITFELELSKPGFATQKVLYFVTRRSNQKVRVVLQKAP